MLSAAIASDGSYDVPEGIICGYPLLPWTMAVLKSEEI